VAGSEGVESLHYDAAIIGAGADGLAAAATLAKSGLKVVVLERNEKPGGRCITREFHPGFHASPFCDGLAPIPPEIFWSLDLARQGAVFVPPPASTALWHDRATRLATSENRLLAQSTALATAALERAATDIAPRKKRSFWTPSAPALDSWPGETWAMRSLTDVLASAFSDSDAVALTMAQTLEGRAVHPELAGSALHLLALPGGSGLVVGGLQRLTDSLLATAQNAGAEIICGLEVTDINRRNGKIAGLRLADGAEISARAIISTLDLKRTFLSLFAWSDLPREVANRAGSFRMTGSTARLLFALDGLPDRPTFASSDLFSSSIHIAPGANGSAYAAWRAGTVAEQLPVTLRFISAADRQSCPPGSAVMTATIGCVPFRLFDGSWTHEKRDALREQVLACIEQVLPGTAARVRACEVIVPPDIEEALGCTDGDLWGGEIASDQMLGFRPWLDCAAPRTPIGGLYLAGPSTTAGVLGTCASGVFAARALAADLKAGRFK
jgi:phytoene dehydrogenase-like protein